MNNMPETYKDCSFAGQQTVAFVVLHYKVAGLTRACVSSILGLDKPSTVDIACIIVDNASNNGSFEEIKKAFSVDRRVHFIQNDANLGFSRANNIGFRYAAEHFSCSYIVVLNNDTVILQKDFIRKLKAADSGAYHLIGPDIYVEHEGIHQSPISLPPSTDLINCKKVWAGLMDPPKKPIWSSAKEVLYHSFLALPFAKQVLKKHAIKSSFPQTHWHKQTAEPLVLHGACLIFTKLFIDTGELPFKPETFLYEEELILCIRFQMNGWSALYTPAIQVIHYDDGATEACVGSSDAAKTEFKKMHERKSILVLENIFNEWRANVL